MCAERVWGKASYARTGNTNTRALTATMLYVPYPPAANAGAVMQGLKALSNTLANSIQRTPKPCWPLAGPNWNCIPKTADTTLKGRVVVASTAAMDLSLRSGGPASAPQGRPPRAV